jgi:hypothetical protein
MMMAGGAAVGAVGALLPKEVSAADLLSVFDSLGPMAISAASGDKASFVSENYPDNTSVSGGTSFTKQWTIKNTGTTTWNSSYKLRFSTYSGARLSSINEVAISGTVKPGYTYTFSVPMKAPAAQSEEKFYQENWKFTDPSGNAIYVGSSSTIWVKIKVPALDITGYSDGLGVVNGKWTGQGPACKNNKGKYYGYYAAESRNPSYWTIKGSGFGTTKGSVSVSDSGITLTITSWSDTEIKVTTKVPYTYTYRSGVTLTVKNSQNQSANRTISTIGIIQTRGYGQCTWYVAYKRLSQGKTIPPSAYTSTPIDVNYVPQQWDCLNYGGKHVGIITSPVTKSEKNGIVTYSLTVGEMNAKCDESESSYAAQFIVDTKNKKIIKYIGSSAGSSYLATGYYR